MNSALICRLQSARRRISQVPGALVPLWYIKLKHAALAASLDAATITRHFVRSILVFAVLQATRVPTYTHLIVTEAWT